MIQIEFMRLFLSLVILSVLVQPALADTHKDELKKVQSDLEVQKARQTDLAKEQENIEQKMGELKHQLLKLSKDLREYEQKVLALQDEKAKTQSDIQAANDKLQSQRKSLATTIMALTRLNQMPPQALLARPSAPIDMARTFDLLQKVIPAISEQAKEIKEIVQNLQDLHDKQNQQELALKEEQKKLNAQQEQLEATVKERKDLLAQNKSLQSDLSSKVAALNGRATNLQDLLHKIEEQARHKPLSKSKTNDIDISNSDNKPTIAKSVKTLFDHMVSSLGSFHLPVTGHIATNFGENTSEGVISQGITIAARPGSIVTAPAGGIVRFAGPFRQYKLLIIIQHPNGDHSLIGGMQELYTSVGSKVAAGEPVGKLPESDKLAGDSNTSSGLYYERRRDGKPIDPGLVRG